MSDFVLDQSQIDRLMGATELKSVKISQQEYDAVMGAPATDKNVKIIMLMKRKEAYLVGRLEGVRETIKLMEMR